MRRYILTDVIHKQWIDDQVLPEKLQEYCQLILILKINLDLLRLWFDLKYLTPFLRHILQISPHFRHLH